MKYHLLISAILVAVLLMGSPACVVPLSPAPLPVMAATDKPNHPSIVPYQRPPSDEFIKINAPFTVGEPVPPDKQLPDVYYGPATYIPYGSVVYHWSNGITEAFGPDKKRIFIAKDSEAARVIHPTPAVLHPTPDGDNGPPGSPATKVYQLPNGSLIKGAGGLFTKIYLGEILILTIVDSPEPY